MPGYEGMRTACETTIDRFGRSDRTDLATSVPSRIQLRRQCSGSGDYLRTAREGLAIKSPVGWFPRERTTFGVFTRVPSGVELGQ